YFRGETEDSNFYAPFVVDSAGRIFYGTNSLNLSGNEGRTWKKIGVPGRNGFNVQNANVDAIAVAPSNSNVVYALAGGPMSVTQNALALPGEVTWTRIPLPYIGSSVAPNSIAVDPKNPDTVYFGTSGWSQSGANAAASTPLPLYRLTYDQNAGTWTVAGVVPGPNYRPVYAVAISPNGTLYVGNDVGLYSSSDGGNTWARVGTSGYNLQLVPAGSAMPTTGKNLVIVGLDSKFVVFRLLHIRIFDSAGNMITDTDETKLPPEQAPAIATLKQQLPGLLLLPQLTDAQKSQVISEATSIVGRQSLTGLPDVQVNDIDLLSVGQIIVGTYGRGAWQVTT